MSLSSPTPDNIHELCSTLEFAFLNAVIDSESSTRKFAERFKELHDSSLTELSCSSFPTVAVAYSTASNISAISSSFIELEYKSTEIENEFISEIDSILRDLTLEDSHLRTSKSITPSDSLSSTTSRSLGYMDSELSAQHLESLLWLLGHLDNPYPPLSTKKALCKQSGLSMKAMNEWFTHVRRRIGWTSILKRHFKGDRQLTVDCAHRILVERSGPLYYSDDILRDVENMRIIADRLYAKKSRQSSLSRNLDNNVNNGAGPSRGTSTSPLPLPTRQPVQTSTHEEFPSVSRIRDMGLEPRNNIAPKPAIRKKRARDAYLTDSRGGIDPFRDGHDEESRPVKKLKGNPTSQSRPASRTASLSTVSSRESTAELLTPMMSTLALPNLSPLESVSDWISGVAIEAFSQQYNENIGVRKRRMSDSDSHEHSKRPRIMVVPAISPETISDPSHSPLHSSTLSAEFNICDIISQFDFSLPPPVSFSDNLHNEELLQFDTFAYSNGLVEPSVELAFHGDGLNHRNSYSTSSPSFSEGVDSSLSSTGSIICEAGCSPIAEASLCTDVGLNANNLDGSNCVGVLYKSDRTTSSAPLFDVGLDLTVQPVAYVAPCASIPADSSETEQLAKLVRINQLLAEAADLQREVFG